MALDEAGQARRRPKKSKVRGVGNTMKGPPRNAARSMGSARWEAAGLTSAPDPENAGSVKPSGPAYGTFCQRTASAMTTAPAGSASSRTTA